MTVELIRFEPPIFVPQYNAGIRGDWELQQAGLVLAPGYWSEPMLVEGFTALLRGGDTWMSVSPMEIESQEIGVRLARGHVVIFGLGMGWAAGASAMMPDVTRVTVVELDPDVIALHEDLGTFDQLPPLARAKLRIEQGDAYGWRPDEPVDLLMPDIWLPLVSEGRVHEVQRMHANVQAERIYFWGQEMEIARHAVAAGRALDAQGIAATIAQFGLPLIGPELADYPERLAAAAHRWMRDRWLAPTGVPQRES